MTKLASALPKGNNGLDSINDAMCEEPEEQHLVIAVIDCSKITVDTDEETSEATARILRIEPLKGAAAVQAQNLLDQAKADRTGTRSLFDGIEGTVTITHGGRTVNAKTGEVVPDDDPSGD